MNRRTFIKTSALATGGVVAAQSAVAETGWLTGDDVIRIGLIGCGGRGTGAAAQALSTKQNVRLVAMGDAFRDRLDDSLKNLRKEGQYDDRIEVTEETKFVGFEAYRSVIELCDVVLIATPPGFRPIHFEAAIDAGKHVFMEKPVATDAPGVRKILAAAAKAKAQKLNVVVGLQRRYQKKYTEWVERLHNGAIGEIISTRVYWNSGGVWTRPRQEGQTEMEYQMRNWYYFNWLCGDHIVEQHIHNLDVGNWVKQAYPVSAMGMGGRQVRTGKEHGEIFDHHSVEYEYADGSRMFSQCRHMKGCQNRVTESFHGSNGNAPKPGLIETGSGYQLWKYRDRNDPSPYQVEHDELFATIANGEFKHADAENGAYATLTAIMGRMATYSGQIIHWDDALNSELSLMPRTFAFDADPPILPDESGFYPIPTPGVTRVL
ncbi:Gfo/Idh/MocA family oxidoreductase [Pontibacter sp. G13]|uniref:Gfo/Idh/MocA family protein n=1 Tax=Pontibacter sp. G13 TaxID=3074898 RepID=UPI00288B2755|nr:Gfo/Idh/MocA family oxidoreductase [Pontibacter sp. G13]WNJ17507.1 Gfo/Idh/MocA family oxidoreductase [Pontibacter sp. G13]